MNVLNTLQWWVRHQFENKAVCSASNLTTISVELCYGQKHSWFQESQLHGHGRGKHIMENKWVNLGLMTKWPGYNTVMENDVSECKWLNTENTLKSSFYILPYHWKSNNSIIYLFDETINLLETSSQRPRREFSKVDYSVNPVKIMPFF